MEKQTTEKKRATKHANGEGGIKQRKDGRYEARYTGADGKRKSICAKTRAEVAKKLNTAIESRNKGIPVPKDEKQTVAEFLTDWLEATRSTIRPSTQANYSVYVHRHIIPEIGKVRMTKLTPQHLQTLYGHKLTEGLSPTTVRHMHGVIHRALEQAVRWGLIVRNIAELVDPPRRARHEMAVLSPDQTRAFLESAREDRLEALFVLAVTTGMRQGELLALRWRDVDLNRSVLQVQATLQRPGGKPVFGEPKTASSRRQIALTQMAVSALRHHRARQAAERLAKGEAWEDFDLVFCNELGKPILATNLIKRNFRPILKRAGLPEIRFHDLRHTAATLYLSRRISPKVVSEMLGHSQIGVTLNVYSHVLPDMQSEAVSALDSLLRPDSDRVGGSVGGRLVEIPVGVISK